MKRKIFTLILVITTLFLTGCGVGNKEYKTSYNLLDNATIDYFDIKCTSYELINEYNGSVPKNGIFLKVNFDIKNNNSNNVLLVPDKFFKLYSNNNFIDGSGTEVSLKSKEVTSYSVVFDTDIKNSYKILFYSNVVTNNIAFEINIS